MDVRGTVRRLVILMLLGRKGSEGTAAGMGSRKKTDQQVEDIEVEIKVDPEQMGYGNWTTQRHAWRKGMKMGKLVAVQRTCWAEWEKR